MALTRVSRHIIDEPFNPTTVSATDVTTTNINASGIGTVGTLRVTGDLTVEGTTTTLDTELTSVDKLEVAANNSTVGAAITQSGTGDILNLYDGSTEVFTVTDGGKVGVGEDNVQAHFHIAKNIADSDAINWTGSQLSVATPIAGNNTANRATIYFAPYGSDNNYAPSAISASAGTSGASTLKFFTNPSGNLTGQVQNYERLRITSTGYVGINETAPSNRLHVKETNSNTIVGKIESSVAYSYLSIEDNSTTTGNVRVGAHGNDLVMNAGAVQRLRITSDGKVRVPDNGKFVAGDGDDLQIFHNTSHGLIENNTGSLYLFNYADDQDIILLSDNGSGGTNTYIMCDGSENTTKLYASGAIKLKTVSTGVDVTGQVTLDGELNFMGTEGHKYIDCNLGSAALNIRGTSGGDANHEFLAKFVRNGPVELYYNNVLKFATTSDGATITGELGFASGGTYQLKLSDNQKIRFGGGNDLQIYHNATHSIINNSTGDLRIESDRIELLNNASNKFYLTTTVNEEINLYYNRIKKFETTNTGAKVTGALEVTQEYPSIRPILDLNFAATKTLDRRITFTRDSIGTYTDENGVLKTASSNVPRFDHDPTTGESLGLLIEESRTNLLTYSSKHQQNTTHNFLGGYTNTVHTQVTNIDPPVEGDEVWIIENQGSGDYAIKSDGSTQSGYVSYSIFLKRYNSDTISLASHFGSSVGTFNLANGTFTNGAYGVQMLPYPNGWYKIIWTRDYSSQSRVTGINIQPPNSTGVYVSGIQIEVGSSATSYISTSGSTVTRSPDQAKITGTNFTDFYNQTEGTILTECRVYSVTSTQNFTEIQIDDGTQSNRIFHYIAQSNDTAKFQAWGADVVPSGVTVTPGINFKHSSSYNSQSYITCLDGQLSVEGNTGTQVSLTEAKLGYNHSANYLNGYIKRLSYYRKKLPNAQLQGLTQQ